MVIQDYISNRHLERVGRYYNASTGILDQVPASIKVIGVGSGGCNSVKRMMHHAVPGTSPEFQPRRTGQLRVLRWQRPQHQHERGSPGLCPVGHSRRTAFSTDCRQRRITRRADQADREWRSRGATGSLVLPWSSRRCHGRAHHAPFFVSLNRRTG